MIINTITRFTTLLILYNIKRYNFKLTSKYIVLKSRGSPRPLTSLA
jgi:hypothetical protein